LWRTHHLLGVVVWLGGNLEVIHVKLSGRTIWDESVLASCWSLLWWFRRPFAWRFVRTWIRSIKLSNNTLETKFATNTNDRPICLMLIERHFLQGSICLPFFSLKKWWLLLGIKEVDPHKIFNAKMSNTHLPIWASSSLNQVMREFLRNPEAGQLPSSVESCWMTTGWH
jgi:hypothetical protein